MEQGIEQLTACPVCKSLSAAFLKVKDFTVSHETFSIAACMGCGLKFTNPRPDLDSIGSYYKSEEYISHSGSGKGLIPRIYRLVQGYNLNLKYQHVKKMTRLNKGRLLDYGCGRGDFLKLMQKKGWQVQGIEPSADAVSIASSTGIEVGNPSSVSLLSDHCFDVISLWHVLEHIHELNQAISQFKRMLKPGGLLVIAVPNYKSSDASYYREYWAGYDVPRHLYHFDRNSMKTLAGNHGLKIAGIHPLWMDAFYVSMLSEKYRNNNTGIISGSWRGLISDLKALKSNEWSSLIYTLQPVNSPGI
ncbi:MAG: class I SAM-dependent methyltransferase [Bacteroidia bacterium]|nr:class I SAM-dependent methyltransferase [Bacteroidia bacterium]